jgi:hypothetical protein
MQTGPLEASANDVCAILKGLPTTESELKANNVNRTIETIFDFMAQG